MNNRHRAFQYSVFLQHSLLRGHNTQRRITRDLQISKISSLQLRMSVANLDNMSKRPLKLSTTFSKVSSTPILHETNEYYWNFCFDKGRIKNFVSWFLLNNGEHKTIALLDRLKTIGFSTATKAGISLGIDDLKIPPKKLSLLYQANVETLLANQKYKRGDVFEVERFQRLISSWHRVSEVLKTEVVRHFEETNTLNPVYMMAFSGARGNISQVRQLVGMRGLMADPQGRIIDFPILSNFREGLTLTEYLISCYGARKGIVDTALRTANAGYLTRRLVDVAHHVIISTYDCGTLEGVALTPMKEGNKLIYSLHNRLIGRVLGENIIKDGKLIAERNQELTHDLASQIANVKTKVTIRSPLTCASKNLVCQLCYGWSLADGHLVSIGETVGIIAAQSIGEPGTQLTMRTFHTGGVFSSDVSDQIKAPYDGIVLFPEPILGTLVRTPEGDVVFLTKVAGEFMIQNIANEKQLTKYKIPAFTLLFSRHKQKVTLKALVAQITGVNQQTAQRDDAEQLILSELEGQVFFASLRVRKYRKSELSELKQNKVEVWTAPLSPSRHYESFDEGRTNLDEKNPRAFQSKTNSIGLIWLLSGKIYQYPTKTVSFLQMGDLVSSTTFLNELIWYTKGDTLTALPMFNLPLVNTLRLCSKTPVKATLIHQQSGINSIQYKNFGYLFKLNPSLFEKSKALNISNYYVTLPSALIQDEGMESKRLLDTPAFGKEEVGYRARPFTIKQSKVSFLGNEDMFKYSTSFGKKSLLHPTVRIYSGRTQVKSGGVFIFEDFLESLKQIKNNNIKPLITQLQQYLFSSLQDPKENRQQQLALFEILQNNEPLFTSQVSSWFKKIYYLQKFITNKPILNARSSANNVFSRKQNASHIKIGKRVSWTSKDQDSSHDVFRKNQNQTVLKWSNNTLTFRLANSKLSENTLLFSQGLLSTKAIRTYLFNPQSCSNLRDSTTSPIDHQTLFWVPQEHYLLTGYYSNHTHSLLGLFSLDYRLRPYGVQKLSLNSFRSTKYLSQQQSKKIQRFISFYKRRDKQTSMTFKDTVLSNCYKEIRTPWVLSTITFPYNNVKAWNHSSNRNFLKTVNRQGFSKTVSSTTGLVRIQQKHSTWPLAVQVAKKGYSPKINNSNQYRQASTSANCKNEVVSLNVQHQTHHYQIDIRQGIVYIPTSTDQVYQCHNQILKPGISKIDDLVFAHHVLIECFPAFSLEQTVTPNLSNENKNIQLSSFNLSITNPRTRYRPIGGNLQLQSQAPLLVLIRPSIQVQPENSILQAKTVTELFQQSANNKLNIKVFNRLAYYTETYNKQVATGNFINKKAVYFPYPNRRLFKVNPFKIIMTSQQFQQKQSGYKILSSLNNSYVQYLTMFENGECLTHLLSRNTLPLTSTIEKQIENSIMFNNHTRVLPQHDSKENSIYYPILNPFIHNLPFVQSARKLKSTVTQRLVTTSFAKNLKLKLQPQVQLSTSDYFFNTLVLSHLSENSGSIEARKIFAEKIFTKFKQKKQNTTCIFSNNSSIRVVSQPHIYLSYLNQNLRTKIVNDLRPWYVRGFFYYTKGEHLSLESNRNRFFRERKETQPDLYLPQEFEITQAKLIQLKSITLGPKSSHRHTSTMTSIVTKLLSGTIVNLLQPAVFQKLITNNFYFSTHQAINFSPVHVTFTSPKYVPSIHFVNINPSSLIESFISPSVSSSCGSRLLKYQLPGGFSFGYTSSIDSKLFLNSVKSHVSATQSFARLSRFASGVTSLGYPFRMARTSCLSPFNGEILHSVQNPTKSQLLILTPKDMVALDLQKPKTHVVTRFKPIKHMVGQFIKFGDLLNSDVVTTETGSIIHISQEKLTLRRSQYTAASHKAVLHVKHNDWIEKNVPLVTLPFQRLKAGDIVQGIPKIEQYFEARKSKAGRFYRDSIPNLMNAIFNEYLTRYRLLPFGTTTAAKKAILKVQQILLNGIQRVYRTQGVSIADKHIEIIVRQMTSKVRILNPGLSSFLPGELVDAHLIIQLNRYLEQEIQFEPIVLGITQASLEVDSFISASSFQQTTRVLSEAALDKKRDYLRGLKENVILGNLMPAGTGHQIHQ